MSTAVETAIALVSSPSATQKAVMRFPLALVLASSAVIVPGTAQTRSATPGVDATLNSESYGFKIICLINGHDVGFKGGQDIVRFVGETKYLHPGRNKVVITYAQAPEEPSDFGLNVQLTVPGYPAPLFYAHVDHARTGKLEGAFDIAQTPPKDFRPLYLSNNPGGTAGFIYLDQDASASGNLSVSINGEDSSTTYQGRLRYAVPLSRLRPGLNKVAVTFATHGGPVRLTVVGPTAMSANSLFSKQKTTRISMSRESLHNRCRCSLAQVSPAVFTLS